MGEFKCPFCQASTLPTVTTKVSTNGWIVFVALIFFCLPLCWLPLVLSSFKEEVRSCSSCGVKLG